MQKQMQVVSLSSDIFFYSWLNLSREVELKDPAIEN